MARSVLIKFLLVLLNLLVVFLTFRSGACDPVLKLPGFGPPAETQYSGFLPIDTDSDANLFYWLVQNRKEPDVSKSPLLIWLQGGPGFSSLYGSLGENVGPYSVDESLTLRPNAKPWNEFAHVMFVDFPVGTGFSYVTDPARYITNDEDAANDMLAFMRTLHARLPQFAACPIYLTGESYAGKWVSAIADRMLAKGLGLHGIVLVSPWIDPDSQVPANTQHAYEYGLLTAAEKQHADRVMWESIKLYKDGNTIESLNRWDEAASYISYRGGEFSPYDIRDVSGTDGNAGAMNRWLAKAEVRRALNAGNRVWNADNGTKVYDTLAPDQMVSALPHLQRIVGRTRILIVNGQYDWVCNSIGVGTLLEQYLAWDGKVDFLHSRRAWRNRGTLAGQAKTGGNLTHLILYNAGNRVPLNQPEHAFDAVKKFLSGHSIHSA